MKQIAVAWLAGLLVMAAAQADTFGRSERIRLMGRPAIEVDGLLDPSAKSSSLRAVDVKYFNRQGGTWVRFTVENGSVLPGNRVSFERPVLKDLKVRQRDGSTEHRAVVSMALCLGNTTLETRLTVSDRSGYTAPLTVGSEDLRRLGRVDPQREFTIEPSCEPIADDSVAAPAADQAEAPAKADQSRKRSGNASFRCDGRQYCSDMNSRAEAEFFVRNCTGTRMDGDNDGVPCESDSRW